MSVPTEFAFLRHASSNERGTEHAGWLPLETAVQPCLDPQLRELIVDSPHSSPFGFVFVCTEPAHEFSIACFASCLGFESGQLYRSRLNFVWLCDQWKPHSMCIMRMEYSIEGRPSLQLSFLKDMNSVMFREWNTGLKLAYQIASLLLQQLSSSLKDMKSIIFRGSQLKRMGNLTIAAIGQGIEELSILNKQEGQVVNQTREQAGMYSGEKLSEGEVEEPNISLCGENRKSETGEMMTEPPVLQARSTSLNAFSIR
eukprot:Gb_29934 [translate_table: standard]